ncbi:hypothetical protein N658DRAFT_281646 [Parathielavia hyrcaniae]|uniref:Uncharacterized protein n=1 Tax=Parathielavia hyrcaniae TaxID=113614 RepID=A0AAN6T3C8_9PEZI|nr:hypothetical protein N658DRAFT_281646 [Parathielavia hyrcaniae]
MPQACTPSAVSSLPMPILPYPAQINIPFPHSSFQSAIRCSKEGYPARLRVGAEIDQPSVGRRLSDGSSGRPQHHEVERKLQQQEKRRKNSPARSSSAAPDAAGSTWAAVLLVAGSRPPAGAAAAGRRSPSAVVAGSSPVRRRPGGAGSKTAAAAGGRRRRAAGRIFATLFGVVFVRDCWLGNMARRDSSRATGATKRRR